MITIQQRSSQIDSWHMVLSYVLLLPMLFFAAGGVFSFESKLAKTQSGEYTSSITSMQSADEPSQRAAEVIICLSVVAICVGSSYRRVSKRLVNLLPLLLVSVWAGASAIWSVDPVTSARNAIYLLLNTAFALYLDGRYSARGQMRLFSLVGTAFLACNFATCLLFPRFGTTPSILHGNTWQGICVHKNVCAYMTVFLLIPVLCRKPVTVAGWLLRSLYVAASYLLIFLTGSRTGWILAGILMILIPSLRMIRRFAKRDVTVSMLVLSLPGLIIMWMGWTYLPVFLNFLGKDATLTGRLPIWIAVSSSIVKHPLIGYGYQAFWHSGMSGESGMIATKVGWNPNFAHNGLLEIGLELGAVGMFLVLWTLIRALRDGNTSFRHTDPSSIDWYLCIVLLTIVVNIDEGTFLGSAHLGWTMYVLACAGLATSAERLRSLRQNQGEQRCDEAKNPVC